MSRFLIFVGVLGLVILLGWRWALSSEKIQWSLYELRLKTELSHAAPKSAVLEGIALYTCQTTDCLMVRSAGREFVIAAGVGAASDLADQGLLSGQLDGVLLTDLSDDRIAGLPELRNRSHEAGRRAPLMVFGPAGTDRLVEGVNAMLESSDAERAMMFQGALPFSAMPLELGGHEAVHGDVIFDSGVLKITQFDVASSLTGADVLYRFDQDEVSLIIGGCRARLVDIRQALRKDEDVNQRVVLPVASQRQFEALREAQLELGLSQAARFTMQLSKTCLSPQAAYNLGEEIGAGDVIAAPLFPVPRSSLRRRIWMAELNNAGLEVEEAPPTSDEPLIHLQ